MSRSRVSPAPDRRRPCRRSRRLPHPARARRRSGLRSRRSPSGRSKGLESSTTATSSPVSAAWRASSSASSDMAPRRSRHHPVGREPITFMPSTIRRRAMGASCPRGVRLIRVEVDPHGHQVRPRHPHHGVVGGPAQLLHPRADVVVGKQRAPCPHATRGRPSRARAGPPRCSSRSPLRGRARSRSRTCPRAARCRPARGAAGRSCARSSPAARGCAASGRGRAACARPG